MNNIKEYEQKLQELADSFYTDIEKLTKEYDKDMFISNVRVSINEVPLVSFQYLAENGASRLEPYDRSEGTKCLVYSGGCKARLDFSSVELKSAKEEDDE